MVNKDFDRDDVWFTEMVDKTTHVAIASSINTERICLLHTHTYISSAYINMLDTACLDQLLITIRSFITLCDHIRSKTRLIAIMNLIATLGIIYTSLHNSVLSRVSAVTAATQCLLLHTNRTRGETEGGE